MIKRIALSSIAILFFCSVYTHASTPKGPFLGIAFSPIPEKMIGNTSYSGIRVDNIVPETAAANSELEIGDFIVMYDANTFSTNNIGLDFKSHIQNQKEGDILNLKVFRDNLKVLKNINNQFLQVNFTIEDVSNAVDQLNYNESLNIKFDRTATAHDFAIRLGRRPFISVSTPNTSLSFSKQPTYTLPELSPLFDHISSKNSHFVSLKENHYENEYWDYGFRLSAVRFLHTKPERMPAFKRMLKQQLVDTSSASYLYLLSQRYLDVSEHPIIQDDFPKSKNMADHIQFIKDCLENAETHFNNSLATLSKHELDLIKAQSKAITEALKTQLSPQSDENFNSKELIQALAYLKKVNMQQLSLGYQYMLKLSDPFWLTKFNEIASKLTPKSPIDSRVKGPVYYEERLDQGLLVIGAKDNNKYTDNIAFIIDLGGNDSYKNNAGGVFDDKALSLCIDLEGDDSYSATERFSQGAAEFGYGLLVDVSGNDSYIAKELSQGIAFVGAAALIDYEGNDSYQLQEFGQGAAFFGTGLLLDEKGDDSYSASLFSQGLGLTKGFGALIDNNGNDSYTSGAKHLSSYGTQGEFAAYSGGFGLGIRHIASGGVGLLVDKKGHDSYKAGNFSLGTGYFYGLGMLLDQHGNDRYEGSRYSMASAAHSAIGIFTDWSGHDYYHAVYGVALSAAWDYSNTYFLDQSGDDTYNCAHSHFVLAESDHNSFAFFHDKRGRDNYISPWEKKAPTNSYNNGKSLSVFLDEGGTNDTYSNYFENNSINEQRDYFFFYDLAKNSDTFKQKN